MGFLTREAILAASDLKRETVPAPEWGGDIILCELSGVERDDWYAANARRKRAETAAAKAEKRDPDPDAPSRNYAARLVAWTARNEDGSDLFAVRRADKRIDVDATEAVAALLASRSSVVLDRLALVAMTLCGWRTKEVEGNSEGTPTS